MSLRRKSFRMLDKFPVVAVLVLLACGSHAAEAEKAELVISGNYTRILEDKAAFQGVNLSSQAPTATIAFRDPERRRKMHRCFYENGIRHFRFHCSDNSFWNVPFREYQSQVLSPYSGLPYPDLIEIREFIEYLHENGMKAVIQINIYSYYDPEKHKIFNLREHPEYLERAVNNQVALVQWINDNNYDSSVLYYELGNDSYHWGAPELLAKIDAAFIRGIRKVAPEAKISVDGQSPEHPRLLKREYWADSVGSWHKRFLTELVRQGIKDGDITYLSQHCYSAWIDNIPFDYPNVPLPDLEAIWQELKMPVITSIGSVEANVAMLRSLGLKNVKIQANEFKRGGSRMFYQRTMMHTLAQTDPLFYFIRNPDVAGATIHDALNNTHFDFEEKPWMRPRGWGIFIPTPEGDFIASPIAVMYRLIDRLLANGDRILNTTASCGAIASWGDGKLKFIVVNKENRAKRITVRLDGITVPANVQYRRTVLNSDRLDSFAVNPITKVRSEFKLKKSSGKVTGPIFELELPCYSISLFEIEGAVLKHSRQISFRYNEAETLAPSDAMDYYETSVEKLKPETKGQTVLYIDFMKVNGIAWLKKQFPAVKIRNVTDADFSKNGLYFSGASSLLLGENLLPPDNFQIQILMKAESNLKNAMAIASDFHFTGLGIWGGRLYAGIKTRQNRYRFYDKNAYPANKWLLFSVSYSGGKAETRINGIPIDTASLTGKVTPSSLCIGGSGTGAGTTSFQGYIREIRVLKLDAE